MLFTEVVSEDAFKNTLDPQHSVHENRSYSAIPNVCPLSEGLCERSRPENCRNDQVIAVQQVFIILTLHNSKNMK